MLNPFGDDTQREEVRTRNKASQSQSLTRWALRDRVVCTGISPATSRQVKGVHFAGASMTLDGNGDQIVLIDSAHASPDSTAVTSAEETTSHAGQLKISRVALPRQLQRQHESLAPDARLHDRDDGPPRERIGARLPSLHELGAPGVINIEWDRTTTVAK